jgi:tetratricopeptide (TPR) repeat protein
MPAFSIAADAQTQKIGREALTWLRRIDFQILFFAMNYWKRFVSWLGSIAATVILAAVASADPYAPANDSEVLETLPRELLSGWDELTTLRRQLASDAHNLQLAAIVASRYLQLGKQEGDPRFNGYAQAAIRPWWLEASPPADILKLRAKLKERDHRYDAALADLRLLLEKQPQDVQAWIELANIYWVQGKYAEARQACENLSQFADPIETIICRVPIQAVSGEAEEAYAALAEILPTVRERWPSAVQWILTMQGEIAQALGRNEQAESHYRKGLAKNPNDFYLLRAYADFLLDRGRNEEVLPLLREHTVDTGILLLAAIAAHRSGREELAGEWRTQLASRFEETRLRGDLPHGKFEARFELELMNDPQRALAVAVANWQLQKAPRDTRNVLEAAIAANDSAAAQSALEFLQKNRTQDVVLQKLAQQLERN